MADPEIATLLVKRSDTPPANQIASTPLGMADVVLRTLSPVKVIAIRTTRAFLQALAGTLAAANLTTLAGIEGLNVRQAVLLAGATATVTLIQNSAELLAKLDQTVPELRG